MMYDVLAPSKVPAGLCAQKNCMAWTSLNTTIDAYWASGKPVVGAGAHCAQLA
eukprot:CAMPEP_0119077522 /NCGR_PEP_ID=MMETSP1178-20130426/95523_1 /TAXON_ID=33656 /ORGANISM="unid sp, Strain CCMP2000" /LENGTH=52 /DNA_ID=CAMNT_0007059893 /DNA_START=42 /DNA_END=196 /DNA_ORIENTATION=-